MLEQRKDFIENNEIMKKDSFVNIIMKFNESFVKTKSNKYSFDFVRDIPFRSEDKNQANYGEELKLLNRKTLSSDYDINIPKKEKIFKRNSFKDKIRMSLKGDSK